MKFFATIWPQVSPFATLRILFATVAANDWTGVITETNTKIPVAIYALFILERMFLIFIAGLELEITSGGARPVAMFALVRSNKPL